MFYLNFLYFLKSDNIHSYLFKFIFKIYVFLSIYFYNLKSYNSTYHLSFTNYLNKNLYSKILKKRENNY